MGKFFRLDSPFMVFLSRMTDLVILSLLWVVCCLPIITIGPSSAALYYVALKIVRGEEPKVSSAFFYGFRKNFKQGVALNLIFIVLGTVLFWDYFIMSAVEGAYGTVSSVIFFVMGIWLLCIMFYAYPMQAQFYNTVKQTLINAAQLSMRKFSTTVLVFALNMAPVLLLLYATEIFVWTSPVWALVAPGVIAFICAKQFVKMFDPFLKTAEKENE